MKSAVKLRTPPPQENQVRLPNRQQRRKYNQVYKTNLTLQDFALNKAVEELQAGRDVSWLSNYISADMLPHKDNWDLFPDGTKVKLRADRILDRPAKYLSEKFVDWVKANQDEEFVISREKKEGENTKGLISLRYAEEGKDTDESKTWLFDLYADLKVWSDADQDYVEPQRVEDREAAVDDVRQSLALVKNFEQSIPENSPDWDKIRTIETAYNEHTLGNIIISEPTTWQDYDSQLQTILEAATMTATTESEEETEPEEETQEQQ